MDVSFRWLAWLSQIEGLLAKGKLDNYPLAHSAKAELCRGAGQTDEAKASFENALAFTSQEQRRCGSYKGGLPKKNEFLLKVAVDFAGFPRLSDRKAEADPNAECGGSMTWVYG
jgi:hypothetical protein